MTSSMHTLLVAGVIVYNNNNILTYTLFLCVLQLQSNHDTMSCDHFLWYILELNEWDSAKLSSAEHNNDTQGLK